jgi:predicted enzyme related to lactoylglutathione lyase
MSTKDSYVPGTPCWVDLGAPDVAAAADFYSALFGWDCPEGDPEFGGYRSCTLGGRTVAGLGPQMGPVSAWTTYIATADARASAEAIVAAGGSMMGEVMEVGDLGTMGLFTDAAGTFLGVWQPGSHIGAQAVNEPGAWTWSELLTRNVDAAKAFYPKVFGWTIDSDAMPGYPIFQVGGQGVGGLVDMPDGFPAELQGIWNTYFEVADCDASCAKVKELGGRVMNGPDDVEGVGRMAGVVGLGGETFSLITSASSTGS